LIACRVVSFSVVSGHFTFGQAKLIMNLNHWLVSTCWWCWHW